MKSVVLCEGRDDLWFIAYYLHKTAGWDTCNLPWSNYELTPQNQRQEVVYLRKEADSVAVWCVGGKDCFDNAISTIFNKIIMDYPFDPIDSIVVVKDRDTDTIIEAIATIQKWLPEGIELSNKASTTWCHEIEGYDLAIKITPIVIPFTEEGAIETLIMQSIREQDHEGSLIVQGANEYIDNLLHLPDIGIKYLSHDRLILKARFSAVIAVTNPCHSTGLFRDMVMTCPWEESAYVKEHFDIIVNAITSIDGQPA